MRTTVNIEDHLLSSAKKHAIERGTTLGAVIEDALRLTLAPSVPTGRFPIHLTTVGGSGLPPGVDINDSAGLLDLLEESTPANE